MLDSFTFTRGYRIYELTNHLGNVVTTITDRKWGTPVGASGSAISYYNADVNTATDYFPFGMPMVGRVHISYGQFYRFGFNGKMNDDDVKGYFKQQDYGMRIYDPRVGRFLSVDPLTKDYPWYTPYQFAGNKPIKYIDLDGAEEYNPDKYAQSDAPEVNKKYRNTLLHKPEIKVEGAAGVVWGILKATFMTFGALTEVPGAMEYGHKVKNKEQEFPLTHGDLGYTAKNMLVAPADVAMQLRNDPGNEELWGEALFMTAPFIKSRINVKIPESFEAAATRNLGERARVFSAGGEIGILNGSGTLAIEAASGKLSGQISINGKTAFLEGKVSIENNVLK